MEHWHKIVTIELPQLVETWESDGGVLGWEWERETFSISNVEFIIRKANIHKWMCTMRNRAKSYRHHNSIYTLSQWTSLYDPRFIDFKVFCGIIFFSVIGFFPWIFLDAVWVDYLQFGFLTYKNNFFDVKANNAELVKWLLVIFRSFWSVL